MGSQVGWQHSTHRSPFLLHTFPETPEGDLSHVMGLSGAEVHCLIPSFIHSSDRRHTQLQWMQVLLTAVGDDKYKVLTWIHICQPQFAEDHHCPCLGQSEAKFICAMYPHWPQQDYNQVWSWLCFFYEVPFKAGQVLRCWASCYHLDIMVYVKCFICITHRVEIFMAGCLKKTCTCLLS